MPSDNLFESIKENLNGSPGQPIVLGVCNALAARFGQEPWMFRAAAIFFGVFYTGLTLIVYVAAGLLMKETEERTRGVFRGLFIALREGVEKCIDGCRDIFGQSADRGNGAR